jgi:hypothetical protein
LTSSFKLSQQVDVLFSQLIILSFGLSSLPRSSPHFFLEVPYLCHVFVVFLLLDSQLHLELFALIGHLFNLVFSVMQVRFEFDNLIFQNPSGLDLVFVMVQGFFFLFPTHLLDIAFEIIVVFLFEPQLIEEHNVLLLCFVELVF